MSVRHIFRLFFSGFCMGIEDVIPGVYGGTIALVLGIYEELITAIKTFTDRTCFRLFLRGEFSAWWQCIHGTFLVTVGLGILTAVATISHSLEAVLEHYPQAVWSLFFGIILASVVLVWRRIRGALFNVRLIGFMLLGTAIAYGIVGLTPVQTPETWWFLMFSGAIAICAMILPGISGAFLLVLLGKYSFILQAVTTRDITSLALFMAGAAIGLLSFARALNMARFRWHDSIVAMLAGFMFGSLRKLWPWKADVHNALPQFSDPGTWHLIGLMVIGVVAVMVLEWITVRINAKNAIPV